MFVPDRIYCMSGSCRVCCRRERSCVSPDVFRCWRSCCSRDTGAALWDEPPGCAAGVHRGMRNSPDISDSHEALWGLTMTRMLSCVNDDRFVVTSIHFHYFIVDWTVILCENQVTFTCGCSYYESAADGQTAHWPVWSPSHILCRRTVYLLCACGRDASVRWTARTRPSSTGSSTFYLQIKFSQIRQQPYAEQPTWNTQNERSPSACFFLVWYDRAAATEKLMSQCLQWNGFSPVCRRMWFLRDEVAANLAPHSSHAYGLSSKCSVRLW